MAKITVDKIRITIGRKVIELAPDELKELRDTLDEVFPRAVTYLTHHNATLSPND